MDFSWYVGIYGIIALLVYLWAFVAQDFWSIFFAILLTVCSAIVIFLSGAEE